MMTRTKLGGRREGGEREEPLNEIIEYGRKRRFYSVFGGRDKRSLGGKSI